MSPASHNVMLNRRTGANPPTAAVRITRYAASVTRNGTVARSAAQAREYRPLPAGRTQNSASQTRPTSTTAVSLENSARANRPSLLTVSQCLRWVLEVQPPKCNASAPSTPNV